MNGRHFRHVLPQFWLIVLIVPIVPTASWTNLLSKHNPNVDFHDYGRALAVAS
jgi:hypothetical protein